MKNKFLKYLSIYNEIFQPKDYRDTQIAKLKNGMRDIENYEINNIVFYGDFFAHMETLLMNFPTGDEAKFEKDPQDRFEKVEDRKETTERGRWEDDDQIDDDEIYDDDDDYDDEDEDVYEEVFKDAKKQAYTPFTDKAKEHEFASLSKKSFNQIEKIRVEIKAIKNGDYEVDLVKNIKKEDFKKLLREKNFNKDFFKYIFCSVINSFDKTHYLKRLLSVRGNNYLWMRSSVKDIIFTPTSRDFISQYAEKRKNLLLIKNLIPDYADKTSEEVIKELEKINKTKEDKNLKQIISQIKNNKNYYDYEEATLIESKKMVLDLFARIKNRFIRDSRLNRNFKATGLRKLIFDYQTGKPSTLTNQVIGDIKKLKDILIKMKYTFNEMELEIGRVHKNDKLYSFKDLLAILKQESTELKSFSTEKEMERVRLLNELGMHDMPKISEMIAEKIKESDQLQIEELKKILGYDVKINKKLSDLIKEAKALDEKQTNEILKKYSKNKLNRLLTLCKEKEAFQDNENKVSKEEYEEAIRILSNPMIITDQSKMKIIFTLSPRAFISQSTRANLANNIRSCMNLFYGVNKKFIPTSLMAGAFAAFLVKVNKDKDGNDLVDSKIIDPLARVLIKPLRDKNGNVFWLPDQEYVSDNKYKGLSDKIFEIINFQSDDLPEEKFSLDDRAHYKDHISEFENNVYFKVFNSSEKIKKYLDDKNISEEEKNIFIDDIKNKYSNHIVFNKLTSINPKTKINIESFFLSRETEEDIIPDNFSFNYLIISNGSNIKSIGDNVKIKELKIEKDSKIKDINNLKYIQEISELDISGNFKYPVRINQSKKLLRLILNHSNLKGKEIIAPNAKVDIDWGQNNLEKIVCEDLDVENCDLRSLQNLECKNLRISGVLIEKESLKIYKDFLKNLEELLNDKKLTGFIFYIMSSDDEAVIRMVDEIKNNTFDYKNQILNKIIKKMTGKREKKLSLNQNEIMMIEKHFSHVKLFEKIYNNYMTIEGENEVANKLLIRFFTNSYTIEDDEHIDDLYDRYNKAKDIVIDYIKKYNLCHINLKSIKKAKKITFIGCAYSESIDLRHLKDLEELYFEEKMMNKNIKIYLPENLKIIELPDYKEIGLKNIQNIKDLKSLQKIQTGEDIKSFDDDVLTNFKIIKFENEKSFDYKILKNIEYYNVIVNNMNKKEGLKYLRSRFNDNEEKITVKKINKYIVDNKIIEKFKEKNLFKDFITEKTIFDKITIPKILPILQNTAFSDIVIIDEKKMLKDKTIILSTYEMENYYSPKEMRVHIQDFHDFYLDIQERDAQNNIEIKIIIYSESGVFDTRKLLEKNKSKKKITIELVLDKGKKKEAKVISDFNYEIMGIKDFPYNDQINKEMIFSESMMYRLDLDTENIKNEIHINCRSLSDYYSTINAYFNIDKIVTEIEKSFKNVRKINETLETAIINKTKELVKPLKIKHSEKYKINFNFLYNQESVDKMEDVGVDHKEMNKKEKIRLIGRSVMKELIQNLPLEDKNNFYYLYDKEILKNLKAL